MSSSHTVGYRGKLDIAQPSVADNLEKTRESASPISGVGIRVKIVSLALCMLE